MRYINKLNRHAPFDEFVEELKPRLKGKDWSALKKKQNKAGVKGNQVQLSLFQHLLQQQQGLCMYCQQIIPTKLEPYRSNAIAHLEHICAQTHCKDLIFEQSNLGVSCEGFNLAAQETSEYRRQFCGHYKDQASKNNVYDPALFLNPTELEDIEDYFYYDAEKGKISNHPEKATTSKESADYMISILNLNNEDLQKMRAMEYSNWLRDYIVYGEEWIKEQLDQNTDELPPFYSMLKTKFS